MKKGAKKLMMAVFAVVITVMCNVGCKHTETVTNVDIHKEVEKTQVLGKWHPCKVCNEKGRCKTCKGSGKQEGMKCIECGGTGACPTCNGEGGYREIIEK